MTRDKAIILRREQKKIKHELYNLKVKMYYQNAMLNIIELINLDEMFELKKKQLILIKCMRKQISKQII